MRTYATNDTTIKTTEYAEASSREPASAWVKMAMGAVFRTADTTMIVAPNSAMLRDRTRTDPATRPGLSWGRVIVRKTCRRFAPRLRAALSRWVSSLTSTAAIERTM